MDLAIGYLASDKPFENRLGARPEGDEESKGDGEGKENQQEGTEKEKEKEEGEADEGGGLEKRAGGAAAVEPLLEALCDTIWGVDVMVRMMGRLDDACFLSRVRVSKGLAKG